MRTKLLLTLFIAATLLLGCSSSKNIVSTLSPEEFKNLSYIFPALNVSEMPNLNRVSHLLSNDGNKNATVLKNSQNIDLSFTYNKITDSIIKNHYNSLGILNPLPNDVNSFEKKFQNNLGDYYIKLIRKKPKNVKTPYWLKQAIQKTKTSKVVSFFNLATFTPNTRIEESNPYMLSYIREMYVIIWNQNGKILTFKRSNNFSKGLHTIITYDSWKKQIFKLLNK